MVDDPTPTSAATVGDALRVARDQVTLNDARERRAQIRDDNATDALNPRDWTEPFLLMSAPDDETCVVPRCRTQSKTRWQVEVIGYQGIGDAPLTGPAFTACLSHLTQQMNRFLPAPRRRR